MRLRYHATDHGNFIFFIFANKVTTNMIPKAQYINLKVIVGAERRVLQSWNEISKVWTGWEVGDIDLKAKINDLINGEFAQYHMYEFYMESDLMEKFNLKYDNVNNGLKGCISRMVVRKKINFSKSINFRGEAHHTHRILKKRSTAEAEKYKKRKKIIRKDFKLGETWYVGDGIKSDNSNPDRYSEERVEYYKKILEEMEKQIINNKEK